MCTSIPGVPGGVRDGGLRRCVLGITDIMGDAGEGEPQGEYVPKNCQRNLLEYPQWMCMEKY